jgi:hypothetical protein
MAGVAAGVLVALGAASARADPPPTDPSTTTTEVTTTSVATTTTEPVTTDTVPTTTTTVTPTTTTRPQATVPTTTTAPAPTRTTAATQTFGPGCVAAAFALVRPGRLPLLVGPVASARLNRLSYPRDGSIATAATADVSGTGCGRPALAHLQSLSLFGSTIVAANVALRTGARRPVAIVGLDVRGQRTKVLPGRRIPLGRWGYLVTSPRALAPVGAHDLRSALAVHLLEPHAGLPARTVILVAVALEQRPAPKKAHRATHQPLTITPPLALRHYVFPVMSPAEYVDTYGAFRSDVPGGWHHGDDIFAPLGTPVVAVASGTINRVGWEHLGGWRLWVRDGAGDEFYYAHLSGYAPGDLRSNRVKAGQVIGFIGNTGDAITTSPHLHFEIHPRKLLHLGYDGAVDPTGYLDHWTHLKHVSIPTPVHPPLPASPPLRQEARYVFRELLAARHLIKHPPRPSERPHIRVHVVTTPQVAAASVLPTPRHGGAMPPLVFALLIGLGSLGLFMTTTAVARSELPARTAREVRTRLAARRPR